MPTTWYIGVADVMLRSGTFLSKWRFQLVKSANINKFIPFRNAATES